METKIDILRDICRLHDKTKFYLIKCEEFYGSTFLQALKEYRDAYDHLIKTFMLNDDDEDVLKNLSAARSHEERAFYDTLDFFTMAIKEKIYDLAEENKSKSLSAVYPKYDKMCIFMSSIVDDISEIRYEREVHKNWKLVERYINIVEKLYSYYQEFFNALHSL